MSAEYLFVAVNALVVPLWLLLALAPRWRHTLRVTAGIGPATLAIFYVVLLLRGVGQGGGSFASLADVRRLFDTPVWLLAGWVHYLAFDLFVGSWQVRDAQRLGLSHLFVLPCLLLTFLFGPAGLLAYLGLRTLARPTVSL
jgi:hypothetical protein